MELFLDVIGVHKPMLCFSSSVCPPRLPCMASWPFRVSGYMSGITSHLQQILWVENTYQNHWLYRSSVQVALCHSEPLVSDVAQHKLPDAHTAKHNKGCLAV